MNARQFGLKLIANVTYGYTSAGFSGRMPMAEIADSIVQVSSQQHGAVVYNPDSALQHAASSNQHACPNGCLFKSGVAEASGIWYMGAMALHYQLLLYASSA